MASFSSYQHFPFHIGFSEEPNINSTHYSFSQLHQNYQIESSLEHNNARISLNDKECVTINDDKHCTNSSSLVLDKLECGAQGTHKVVDSMDNKRKIQDSLGLNSVQNEEKKDELRRNKKQKKINNGEIKKEEEKKVEKGEVEEKEETIGYIHVRARRGQATDSHSLAERVRREKISEKMKLLQDLVPGCDKVTGKAMLLDEIINYVQSLQSQVEFLSMKLASLDPTIFYFGVDLDGFIFTSEVERSTNESTGTLTNTFTALNNYHPMDTSSIVFQQAQMSNINLPQSNGQMLWDMDQQRLNALQLPFTT